MPIDMTNTCARRQDACLRDQRARIEQRHLQFGRHCCLDIGSLLSHTAHRVRVAPLVEVAVEREHVATDPVQRSTLEKDGLETVDHWTSPGAHDAARAPERLPSGTATPHAPTPNRHRVRGPVTVGDFVASNRGDAFRPQEWVATPADRTNVVVSDWCAAPSPLGIEKAGSIVQGRAYLEHRACGLLLPFTKEAGSWRLVTIDFGTEARRHGCEFLMCFPSKPRTAYCQSPAHLSI
jgi:hypothetical protein